MDESKLTEIAEKSYNTNSSTLQQRTKLVAKNLAINTTVYKFISHAVLKTTILIS